MSERDKYSDPGYSVMQNWKIYALILAPLITSIGVFAFLVRKTDLTFDSQVQKYNSIQHYDSKQLHTTYKEKADLVILKQTQKTMVLKINETAETQTAIQENQVKIGQDLEQIKGLIKNIDKK